MGGIEYHRAIRVAHDRQRTHVRYQIVIAKRSAALADHDVVDAAGFTCFIDHVFHIGRRQKLAFFDIHRLAATRNRMNKIGLTAKKCRGLQHIHNARHGRYFLLGMNICQDRYAKLFSDFRQNPQAFFHTGATECFAGTAIGFIVTRFKNERDTEFGGDFLERTGGVDLQLLRLDHTGPCNQKKRLVESDFKATEFHEFSLQRLSLARYFTARHHTQTGFAVYAFVLLQCGFNI